MEESANKYPNLRPFKPGQSGNPKGRKSAGASIREHWNSMADWKLEEIHAVANDPNAPAAQVAAANSWIAALKNRDDLEQIIGHTAGKPKQSIEVTATDELSDSEELGKLLEQDPEAVKLALELEERMRLARESGAPPQPE